MTSGDARPTRRLEFATEGGVHLAARPERMLGVAFRDSRG